MEGLILLLIVILADLYIHWKYDTVQSTVLPVARSKFLAVVSSDWGDSLDKVIDITALDKPKHEDIVSQYDWRGYECPRGSEEELIAIIESERRRAQKHVTASRVRH